MKAILILLSIVFTTSVFAQRQPATNYIEGVVVDVFCGEIDPYYVGDACISYIQTPNSFFGIVTEDYGYNRSFPKSQGKLVRVYTSYLLQYKSRGAILELKYIRDDAFYLFAKSINAFVFVQ